ncbi:MAG TPA: hypothetical protein PLS03_12145 [Terrimicrobiaceae bacterium]|nr:hypothetical protein [Terrimicrobiaceae bacterium]
MNWGQWRTILWLRWRLTRNQWRRFGPFNEAAGILLGLILAAGVAGSCVAGVVLGLFVLPGVSAPMLMLVWDGIAGMFLLFWLTGLLTEIQRSESIDLHRLMHLPIPLRAVFLFNYLASWITPSLLIAFPGCVCLAGGMALAGQVRMLWMIPVITAYFALVTAWTYLLRGWLVAVMINERHRRTILTGAALVIILITQLPNLYFQMTLPAPGKSRPERPSINGEIVRMAHNVLPPLWAGRSALALARHDIVPAAAATCGGLLLAGIGLRQAYRSTRRFYQGGKPAAAPARRRAAPAGKPSTFLEGRLPGLAEETSAVALATFRSHLRAPEIKMALFGQVMMIFFLAVMLLRPAGGLSLAQTKPVLGTLVVLFSLLGSSQLLFNQFGFDRDGFRAIVLSPAGRQHILQGKNLAAFPFVTTIGTLILTAALAIGMIDPAAYFSALLMLASGFLLFAILGNLLSMISPYRIAYGSLKPTKLPPRATLMIFAGFLLSALLAALLFIPAGLGLIASSSSRLHGTSVHLAGSLVLFAGSAAAYAAAGGPLGRMLQRREQTILQIVTTRIE